MILALLLLAATAHAQTTYTLTIYNGVNCGAVNTTLVNIPQLACFPLNVFGAPAFVQLNVTNNNAALNVFPNASSCTGTPLPFATTLNTCTQVPTGSTNSYIVSVNSFAETWSVMSIYPRGGTTCSGDAVAVVSARTTGVCVSSPCSALGAPLGAFRSAVQCLSGGRTQTNMIYDENFPSTTCTGSASSVAGAVPSQCTPSRTANNGTARYSCDGTTVTTLSYTSADCTGTAVSTTTSVTPCNNGRRVNCPPSTVCFHESTQITYKSAAHTMQSLAAHSECRIPHVVTADGVSIATSCGGAALRLTGDHLVFTSRGLVAAGSLAVHDVLFGDLEESKKCVVTAVARESSQRYFGLNCRQSTVLANAIKTSTFGRFHTLPSLWMSWGASVLGVERASRWGDSIANALVQMKML